MSTFVESLLAVSLPRPRFIALVCGTIVIAVTLPYLLLVLLPYYGNGIHLHPYAYGVRADVQFYPPFSWPFIGCWFWGLALFASAFAPLMGVPSSLLLLLTVVLAWRTFPSREKAIWLATIVTNVFVVAATWQELPVIGRWLVDML